MYFHGPAAGHQKTFLAQSQDGIRFTAGTQILAPFYLRLFHHAGACYGIAKDHNRGGILLRSPDGIAPFVAGPNIIERMRHAAVRVCGNELDIVFSRGQDCPEHLLHSRMSMAGDWQDWRPDEPRSLLMPEMDWEGADLALEPSRFGAIHGPARQLRDPAFFEEDGQWYLLYSVAGESGLAIARLHDG